MKIVRRSAILSFLLLFLTITGFGAPPQEPEAAEPGQVWALIIGVSNYSHAEPLLYAATDAQSFKDFLQSPRGGEIPDDHLITMLEEDATRTRLEYEIYSMTGKVKPGDSVYIFVAGHGLLDKNGIAFFLPIDGNPREPFSTSMNLLAFQQVVTMGFAAAKQRILITDMCHSGTLADQQNMINDYMAKQFGKAPGGAFLNLLASGPNESSWENEELGHGVFTYALLEALNGRGVETTDARIRAQNLVSYVQAEVPQWTAFQQNPVANETFDPALELSFLDLPGPTPVIPDDGTILVLLNGDKSDFVRIQWVDPTSEAVTVRKIPKDQKSVPIGPLSPGPIEIALFNKENTTKTVQVSLELGQNTLDVQGTQVGQLHFRPASARQVASLSPSPFPAPPYQQLPQTIADLATGASLVLKLDPGTEVFVDDEFYGNSRGTERPLQVQALATGPHTLRLVHSPEYEQRFRLKLFDGPQLFDPQSGELRALDALEPPPTFLAPPAQLPANQADLYRRFATAIWEERLVEPEGDSAWDHYSAMEPNLSEDLRESLRRQLVVAMGDKAQRIVLKYLRGGDIKWAEGVFDEGAKLTSRIRRLFRSTPIYESQEHFFRGRALIESGQFDAARTELQKSIDFSNEASQSYNSMGLAYWKQGMLDEALPPLERSIELTPFWNYPRITRAFIHLEQRLYDEAEAGLLQAVEVDPEDSTAHHALGQVYMILQRWSEAEEQVNRSIEFDPGNAYALETAGLIHQRLQNFDEAEDAFRLAMRLEPEELSFRVSLAELLRLLGRIPEAASLFADLMDQRGNSMPFLISYAEFLSRLNRTDEADTVFKKALQLDDENVELRLKYGVFLRGQEKYPEAVRQMNQVLKSDPDNHFAPYQLAEIAFAGQQLSEAEKQARRSLDYNPRYAPPLRLLGQIRFAQREHDEALDYFRRSRDLATEAHQKQELQELIDQVEAVIVSEEIERANQQIQSKQFPRAWQALATTLKRAPESRTLRDAILDFQQLQPAVALADQLPPAAVTSVLKTGFWQSSIAAEAQWNTGQKDQALANFTSALEALGGNDLIVVTSTAFNFENQRFSIHEVVDRWVSRLLEDKQFDRALEVLDLSMKKRIFGAIPDYSPLTINSLMRPGDDEPATLEDFDMAHHGDRRVHELYAAAFAGSKDLGQSLKYLEALEPRGPDLSARIRMAKALYSVEAFEDGSSILREALTGFQIDSNPDLFVSGTILYAEILCASGDCDRATATLQQARQLVPDDEKLRKAIRELR